MADRDRNAAPAVGGSSLLVIFAVLCLTTFALLGLSTVQADTRLSDAVTQAVSEYYAADWAAEEIFARLRNGELPDEVSQEGNVYSYACPISDNQELQVEVTEDGYGTWTVLRWQAVYTADWQSDLDLDVWDGTFQ